MDHTSTANVWLRVRRHSSITWDRISYALATRTRARVVLWLTLMVAATSLTESGVEALARFGARLALICLGIAVLEVTGATVVWAWRRLRRRRREAGQ